MTADVCHPYSLVLGLSSFTRITKRGSSAGPYPANEALVDAIHVSYTPLYGICAVHVFPATAYQGTFHFAAAQLSTQSTNIDVTILLVFSLITLLTFSG
jgi:hypothetical protein